MAEHIPAQDGSLTELILLLQRAVGCYGTMVISGGYAPPRPARAGDRGSKHSNRRQDIQAIHFDPAPAEVDGGQLASSAA
jgi:hypothetical protein